MSKLRLLLVTDTVGGVWVYSLELARALVPYDVEVTLAVIGPPASPTQREQAEGIRLIDTGLPLDWLPTTPAEMHRAGEAIAALASKEGMDLVQTCSAPLLADTKFDQPTIAVQHSCVASWWSAVRGTPLPPEFMWRRDLVQEGLNRARAVVAPSVSFAAETARIYDVSCPVMPVHNGRQSVVPLGLPQSNFVLTASRLWDEGKNVATLDAAARLTSTPFEAAGPLAGPNGTRAAFNNIHHVGELASARLSGVLATRPIYASSALYEPFGLSVLEAANAGCALVLSDIPTFRELWRDSALFVPARDPRAFADAVDALMKDTQERERLGRAARNRAQLYTPARMGQRMAGIYRSLLPRAAATPQNGMAGAA
ncbi:glycosyltransferase family 4 protein [Sphingomonas piscis]|uniref:Glycosyltransferase family 4 protein n=1 Tax=Sphingomonas piscis TaxID=2714943 RepID=A0A6G7YPC1_9SPHN|nr:glycosyltransferase family 4 protein [Sphingomonas piscis]QIK78576.1 glycosyltransferase family 4 protein [Sphingomonas piscis]